MYFLFYSTFDTTKRLKVGHILVDRNLCLRRFSCSGEHRDRHYSSLPSMEVSQGLSFQKVRSSSKSLALLDLRQPCKEHVTCKHLDRLYSLYRGSDEVCRFESMSA